MDSLTKIGISNVALHGEALCEDLSLWRQVENDDYNVVYVTLETLLSKDSSIWKMFWRPQCPPFLRNLALIVIDECHTASDWVDLWPHFQEIGAFWLCLSGVPFMGLSATLTSMTAKYFISSFHLNTPLRVKETIMRKNMSTAVYEIKNDLDDLNGLIPEDVLLHHLIPQTMVFIDNINQGIIVACHLHSWLPEHLQKHSKSIIRLYNADIDEIGKVQYIKDYRDGTMRIFIATDACGMGMDFHEISGIVQWKLTLVVTAAMLFQRFGRGGWNLDILANAQLFFQSGYKVENLTQKWLESNGIKNSEFRGLLGGPGHMLLHATVEDDDIYSIFKECLTLPVDRHHHELNLKFMEVIIKHRDEQLHRIGTVECHKTKVDLFILWLINS